MPSIIAYAACCAAAAMWLRTHDTAGRTHVTASEAFGRGMGFVRLGAYMTAGSIVTLVASYAFNAWLNHAGGTAEVGLYQAGYTLVNKYTGLVLTALGMEYYPRLARVATSRRRLGTFVCQEICICMMAMAPVVVVFMLLRAPIVTVLYSSEFAGVLTMVSWCLVGTVLRGLSWCMSFVILAKGDGRVFLVTETLSAAAGLGLNIAFYNRWGLDGLGVSFAVWYAVYVAIVSVVYFHRYKLRLSGRCLMSAAWAMAAALCALAAMQSGNVATAATVAVAAVAVSAVQARRMWRH